MWVFFVFTFSCLIGSLLLGEILPSSTTYQECLMFEDIVRFGLLFLSFLAAMVLIVWLKYRQAMKVVTVKSPPWRPPTFPDPVQPSEDLDD